MKRECMRRDKAYKTNIPVSVTGKTGNRTRDFFVYGLDVRTAIAAKRGTVGMQRAKAALYYESIRACIFYMSRTILISY